MSVQSEINRISGNVTAALAAIAEKGVDVPAGSKSDALASLIAAIEAGGGGNAGNGKTASGTITVAQDQLSGNLVTIDTGVVVRNALNTYVALNSIFVLWKKTTEKIKGSYIVLYTHNALTYTYGYRPNGSAYNTESSSTMKAEVKWESGESAKVNVNGDTTVNFTFGLVAGVEYGWYFEFFGETGM